MDLRILRRTVRAVLDSDSLIAESGLLQGEGGAVQ